MRFRDYMFLEIAKIKEEYDTIFNNLINVARVRSRNSNNFLRVFGNYEVLKPKQVTFTLVFDDLCARSRKNSKYDFGGDPNKGINKWLKYLLAKYPFLKITLFMIPSPLTKEEVKQLIKEIDEEKMKELIKKAKKERLL